MKAKLILLTVCIALISCNGPKTQTKEQEDAYYDSLSIARTGKTISERARESTDSVLNKIASDVYMDTAGLSKGPVKVIKAVLFKEEYSSYRDIRVTYKNVSKKTVAAIKFRWKGTNAFGDPADMGSSLQEGYGGGFTDDSLRPGRTEVSEWSILSKDGKKVELAWAYEVVFADGTKWELEK